MTADGPTVAGGAGVPRTHRLTVQMWINGVMAAMAVLVMVSAGVGGLLLSRTDDATNRLAEHITPARAEILRLQAAMVDQETGVRGYLLSHDKEFLVPYQSGLVAERSAASRLRTLLVDDPRLLRELDEVRAATSEWRRVHAVPLIAEGATAGADRSALEASKASFDGIRARFAVQNRHIGDEQAATRAGLDDDRFVSGVALIALVAAFLLSGVVLALLMHRGVGGPIRSLRTASRKVAGGDFGHRIAASGPRDIRELGIAVEDMRRRIVEELATSREQEELLTTQATDLDAQTVELRRSNAELEQFAYVASHDLQEPLRKVASFCQLIEKRYGDLLDERGTQYIAFAVDGAKRMQVLINDLLAFSRVGRLNDTSEPVPMDAALDKALDNLGAVMEESQAHVERPTVLPELTGDPTLLTMLWQNLVGNAIKFRDPDRVPSVRISCTPGEEEATWDFAVSDNGIGIPEEFSEKVFVIFQRLHARDAYSGTGIGLALCKKIVEHHGGHIFVDPTPERGTRIRFTLPAPPAVPADPGPETDGTTTEEPDETGGTAGTEEPVETGGTAGTSLEGTRA